jgi:16S rRNA (guanine966-N2)-methyltransferase
MRIIAGKMKGISLFMVPNKNTRPLKDMVRESIFNLLTHSNKFLFQIEKSNILDLYAGTGSFGLECLSRNSKNVSFIEKDKTAIKILEKNIEKLKVKKKINIYQIDVINFIKKSINNKYDLIFCDPPFKNKDMDNLVTLISTNKLLKKNGIIIIHRKKDSNDKFPNDFKVLDERLYGISKIIFGKILS